MPRMNLEGSSSIITGGASGIGEASARQLAAAGSRVVIADLQEDKGQALASELGGLFVKCDVTKVDDADAAVAAASEMGPPRALVNSAGIGSACRTVDHNGEPFNADAVVAFLRATEEFNAAWAADPESQNPTIAAAAGMEDVANFLGGDVWFAFPSIDEQLSADWLGGNVADAMQGQVETLAELGGGDAAVGDFAGSVDTSFLEAAKG